jgi:hypothetical protein
MVQEGREYVHLLLIECWAGYDLNKKNIYYLLGFCYIFGIYIVVGEKRKKRGKNQHFHLWYICERTH